MGQPGDPPLDRRTGQGRVDATPGHYHDALAKGNTVHLLATESTGALSSNVIRLLRELAKTAQGTSGHDSTVYGLSRASPKSFFPHAPPRRHLLRHCLRRCALHPQPCCVLSDAALLRNDLNT
jgi:hypothetical protein